MISEELVRLKLTSTPSETRFQMTLKGTNVAISTQNRPVTLEPHTNVPFLSWRPKEAGMTPSCAIAPKSSGCGRKARRTMRGRRIASPTLAMIFAQIQPRVSKASGHEVASFEEVIPVRANWDRSETRQVMPRVVRRARGMVFAGSWALPARQQTSSKPTKPQKSAEAPCTVPPKPWGKNTSGDSNTLRFVAATPATRKKHSSITFAIVKPLMTILPKSTPALQRATASSITAPAPRST
mmetsp:Transcript_74740/g.196017  ORF Transcript_74740/g.196017 Transcript_74740/m.196017 type:complete len:239 (+) Transcript_74740:205-921(+)